MLRPHCHCACKLSEVPHRHAGLRTRNLDVKALQAVFELLQSHYPERLHALWFLNAPFIFWGVWRMVRLLSGPPHSLESSSIPVVVQMHCDSQHSACLPSLG